MIMIIQSHSQCESIKVKLKSNLEASTRAIRGSLLMALDSTDFELLSSLLIISLINTSHNINTVQCQWQII